RSSLAVRRVPWATKRKRNGLVDRQKSPTKSPKKFHLKLVARQIRTGMIPRWMAFLGYALALLLLLSIGYFYWIPLAFPLWVLLVSAHILFFSNLRESKSDSVMDPIKRD
ncbi:MAG: hypothetical protein AB1696_28030, partial [Planctomycetota bacterium]